MKIGRDFVFSKDGHGREHTVDEFAEVVLKKVIEKLGRPDKIAVSSVKDSKVINSMIQ